MPNVPFTTLTPRVRKDPLGPIALNALRGNSYVYLPRLAGAEHDTDGTHNAWEIPRTVGGVNYGGSYSAGATFNSRLSSLASGSTGVVTLTLAANQFTMPRMLAQVSPRADGDVRPCIATAEMVSSTSVVVRLKKLSVALGVGNTWAAYDGTFSVALHGEGILTSAPLAATKQWYQQQVLTDGDTDWNAIVQNLGTLRKRALVEHGTNGAHVANVVARDVGWCDLSGTTYTLAQGTPLGVSRVSAGVVDVTMKFTYGSTATMLAFPSVQATSNTQLWVINPIPQSTTVCRFHIFLFDAGAETWDHADAPFAFAVYGS